MTTPLGRYWGPFPAHVDGLETARDLNCENKPPRIKRVDQNKRKGTKAQGSADEHGHCLDS
jgi:hypothetical protein